ncbi:DUF927 domain-containing protein [Candidatus Magnetaquicoccus inordinatus]|uniref:DUF927 domain-containing protein n=1 Tax=Candidatus Magnetaquicoccus inordinatus TaxID=2496818 RepID=UPI00102AB3A1|nr:DUF927 domain-containing protein [Candidatus Magnetaquicoccus inordinatus]
MNSHATVGGDPTPLGRPQERQAPLQRPCYRVYEEEQAGRAAGLYYHGFKESESRQTPVDLFVCGPLYVEAQLSELSGLSFCRLLRFRDTTGVWKSYVMPMTLLSDRGEQLRAQLLDRGLLIDLHNRAHLQSYLQSQIPSKSLSLAKQVGWHQQSFVLPDEIFGDPDIYFQGSHGAAQLYACSGSLSGWQKEIATYCQGNPLLLFAVSAAFAGVLLRAVGRDGFGFHFVGDSSTGKTTALRVAASVWGGQEFQRSWRATGNGLEAAAAQFNDGLMVLDEIAEVNPREAGSIIYALSNGRGKQRADRHGEAKELSRWRVLLLSSGERMLATYLSDVRMEQRAGQEVRLLDVHCHRRYGMFDELHGMASGRELADHLRGAVKRHHGEAGRAFLRALLGCKADWPALYRYVYERGWSEFVLQDGLEQRAAQSFALVAMAGELATQDFELCGWEPGAALQAAVTVYKIWLSNRGRGNSESKSIISKVLEFLDLHGDSRFSALQGSDEAVRNRAGWYKSVATADGGSERHFLFTSAGLREALAGFDFRRALAVLEQSQLLVCADRENRRERADIYRVGGRLVRLYTVVPKDLHCEL